MQLRWMMNCSICGGSEFTDKRVLWPGLIVEWGLAPWEADYIDRQQGTCCVACGGNLRSCVLARAICQHLGGRGPLQVLAGQASPARILEINPAGTLNPVLSHFPHHRLVRYPEVDMHAMPFGAASFDLVVHSDTLEHIADPVQGLRECRRVLARGGACIFTVPMIVDRMTRRRDGLPASYHGAHATASEDLLVRTEFGADAWTYGARAGFERISLVVDRYPEAVAIVADF